MNKDDKLEKLIITLKKLKGTDPEDGHIEADNALLEYINNSEVTKAFNELTKWYC